MTEMIKAIWPSFATLPNSLPESAGITSAGMISYFIYWLIQFPFMLIPTHRLHYMFWLKTVLVTPTALAMVIWISVKAGQGGDFFNQPSTVHGSTRAWLWLSSLTSITGGFSTLAVNISDFSRFSKHRTSHYAQLPMIPFFKCIVGVLGVVAASASTKLYGKTLWSPLSIIAMWQGSPGGRAAAFFAAAVWMLAQICVNISANSVSFGNGEPRRTTEPQCQLTFARHHYTRAQVDQSQARSGLSRRAWRLGYVSVDHHQVGHFASRFHGRLCMFPRANSGHHVFRLLDCKEASVRCTGPIRPQRHLQLQGQFTADALAVHD